MSGKIEEFTQAEVYEEFPIVGKIATKFEAPDAVKEQVLERYKELVDKKDSIASYYAKALDEVYAYLKGLPLEEGEAGFKEVDLKELVEQKVRENPGFFEIPQDKQFYLDKDTLQIYLEDIPGDFVSFDNNEIRALVFLVANGRVDLANSTEAIANFATSCSEPLRQIWETSRDLNYAEDEFESDVNKLYFPSVSENFENLCNRVRQRQGDKLEDLSDLVNTVEFIERNFRFRSLEFVENLYLKYRKTIEGLEEVDEAVKTSVSKILLDRQDSVYNLFLQNFLADVVSTEQSRDLESAHCKFFLISPEQKNIIRRRNFVGVATYIGEYRGTKEVAVDNFRQLHALATADLMPPFIRGRFRYCTLEEDKFSGSDHYATRERVRYNTAPVNFWGKTVLKGKSFITPEPDFTKHATEGLISEMNTLVGKERLSEQEFRLRLATLIGKVAALHPFADGNGQTAVFLAEFCTVARGNCEPIEEFAFDYEARMRQVFRGSRVATNVMKASFWNESRKFGTENIIP